MRRDDVLQILDLTDGHVLNYNGYDVFVSEFQNGMIVYPIIIMRFEQKLDNNIVKEMRKSSKKVGAITLDKNGYSVKILCTGLMGKYNEKKAEKFKESFSALIDWLNANNITTLKSCVICRDEKEEEIEEHIINNMPVKCHRTCFESFKDYHMNEIIKNETNVARYPLSIFLAIVGGLIGYLPFFLVMIFTNYMVGPLFILIPLAAFYGFKLGKAPLNMKATWIIIAISAIIIVGCILGFLGLLKAALESVGKYYTYGEVVKSCVTDIIFSVVFGGIGIFASYKIITKDNNENKLSSMR